MEIPLGPELQTPEDQVQNDEYETEPMFVHEIKKINRSKKPFAQSSTGRDGETNTVSSTRKKNRRSVRASSHDKRK